MNTADDALTIFLPSPADTEALGRALARFLGPGDVLALIGPLGSGKSTLVRGLLAAFGLASSAASPTFGIMHVYEGPLRLVHADAWRLRDEDEFADAGCCEEMRPDTIFVVEWAEKVASWLPPDRLEIRLDHSGGGRSAVLRPFGAFRARFAALARALSHSA